MFMQYRNESCKSSYEVVLVCDGSNIYERTPSRLHPFHFL